MKRKILFFAMMVALTGLFTMQSCNKDEGTPPVEVLAAVPDAPVPAVEAIIPFTGANQAINLSWAGTASNAIKWDVYFGDSEDPDLVAEGVTTNSYTAHVPKGGTYYWYVSTIDANEMESTSDLWDFVVNSSPAAAGTPVPAANATAVSCNAAMSWVATDPEGDHLTYDLYLGKTNPPTATVGTALADPAFTNTTTLTALTDYYWKVVAKDPYGGTSTSPIWKFTTGSLPITKFTGNYKCDEPAEAYDYTVAFTFVTASTIKTTNYWNSGWSATFTIDLAKLTYSFPLTTFQTGWTGVESGIVDPATGKMVGTYSIWQNNVLIEQGVHTYTKL